MRFPRLTLRWTMVLVAVAAVVCLIVRQSLKKPPRFPDPFGSIGLRLGAPNRWPQGGPWMEGQPVPVTIDYDLALGSQKPANGAKSRMLAEVWFEDQATRRYVSGYTFDVTLTTGSREATSGSFVWQAEIPGPGRYFLHSQASIVTPDGPRLHHGQGSPYIFHDSRNSNPGTRP